MEHVSEARFACDDKGDAFCSFEEAFREAFGVLPPGAAGTQHPPLDDNADGVGHYLCWRIWANSAPYRFADVGSEAPPPP